MDQVILEGDVEGSNETQHDHDGSESHISNDEDEYNPQL
jgi:hypothetical protein